MWHIFYVILPFEQSINDICIVIAIFSCRTFAENFYLSLLNSKQILYTAFLSTLDITLPFDILLDVL